MIDIKSLPFARLAEGMKVSNGMQILKKIYNSASIDNGYVGILNVQNNNVVYSNVTPLGGTTNAITKIKSVLPPFSFNENGQGTSSTNKIALNKSYLNIFKNMKSKNANWNSNIIEALLKTNNFQIANSKLATVATCIYNLFNNKMKITPILKANKDTIITFDSNNKYLTNESLSGESK